MVMFIIIIIILKIYVVVSFDTIPSLPIGKVLGALLGDDLGSLLGG